MSASSSTSVFIIPLASTRVLELDKPMLVEISTRSKLAMSLLVVFLHRSVDFCTIRLTGELSFAGSS